MDFIGIERDRLHFSWISSAEATKFIEVVNQVVESVKALGPNTKFIKNEAKAA
jgi:coenzyme F420-reducing hydrogenase delta subunit